MEWIKHLNEDGKRVAVIKHHGHRETLAMPDERKDSIRYLTAGAHTSIVSGGGCTQHIVQEEPTFSDLFDMAIADEPDVVLVEGFKRESGPKVVLVREKSDWTTLKQLDNIVLVIGIEDASIPYDQIATRELRSTLDAWLFRWLDDALLK